MNIASFKVGFFLAMRYIRRSNVWASFLIVFIMTLTFLNIVVVRGILVGLPEGAKIGYQEQYSGDVIITPYPEKRYIERSRLIENILPSIKGYENHSARYLTPATIEANYKSNKKASDLPDIVGAQLVGINPDRENQITNLSSFLIEGQFLYGNDDQGIVLGHQLLERFTVAPAAQSLEGVYPGDKVRVAFGDVVREYTVRGIIKSKVGENGIRAFINDDELRRLLNRTTFNVNEIAISVTPDVGARLYKESLLESDISEYADIETSAESQGQFLEDVQNTFETLSTLIGVIGIAVASITVFIVIFINAINRQKEIGILKGIGINRYAIEISYIILSVIYALLGISIGSLVLYLGIDPYITDHPIDFPFADGVLVAPYSDTLARSLVIIAATIGAGYIPSRIIVSKKTINAILER